MERKPLSVLDASVVLKWFIEEEDSAKARVIQDDFVAGKINLVFPDLLVYEVSNALRFNKTFNLQEIDRVLSMIGELKVDIFPVNFRLVKNAVKIAYDFGLTVYDAIYVSLAVELGGDFITADRELFNKMKGNPSIKLLGK